MTKDQATAYHDLQDINKSIALRLSGYVRYIKAYMTDESLVFTTKILLTNEKNFGDYYILGGKDLRYYVSNINAEFKSVDPLIYFTYLKKPEIVYTQTTYLGQKIDWNMGYRSNKFILKVNMTKL